jgi:RNA recognition motif-containing protein
MSFTIFLGNLPAWVTADDIKGWLSAENLVADAVKVIRNPETQESKGFAFIEAPNSEEMNAIIKRFDRAPLEDRLLRANPAQPPRSKGPGGGRPGRPRGQAPGGAGGSSAGGPPARQQGAGSGSPSGGAETGAAAERPPRRGKRAAKQSGTDNPSTAFAEELAKAL